MIKKRTLRAVLAALFLSPLVSAQEQQVRLVAERVPEGLGRVALASGDSVTDPFDLPVNNLSDPVNAPGRSFRVRATEKNVDLATVSLPERGRSFAVLLVPERTGGYKPVVVPTDGATFRAGDTYFYNHSDKPVLGYVGTARFTLTPNSGRVVRPQGAREGRFYDVGFGVREPEGDRPLSTSRWPVDNHIRSYVFFFNNPTNGRVDFRAVDEPIAVPAAE